MGSPNEPTPPPELAAADHGGDRLVSSSQLWIVLGVLACVVISLALATLSLGYYSTRRFAMRSHEAEGKVLLGTLSRGIARCVEEGREAGIGAAPSGLPASAPAVPGSLTDVAGKGFESTSMAWSHATYACAEFAPSGRQRYQVEWVLTSANTGIARVRSDADGDGKPDLTFEIDVRCEVAPTGTATVCTRGPDIREIR